MPLLERLSPNEPQKCFLHIYVRWQNVLFNSVIKPYNQRLQCIIGHLTFQISASVHCQWIIRCLGVGQRLRNQGWTLRHFRLPQPCSRDFHHNATGSRRRAIERFRFTTSEAFRPARRSVSGATDICTNFMAFHMAFSIGPSLSVLLFLTEWSGRSLTNFGQKTTSVPCINFPKKIAESNIEECVRCPWNLLRGKLGCHVKNGNLQPGGLELRRTASKPLWWQFQNVCFRIRHWERLAEPLCGCRLYGPNLTCPHFPPLITPNSPDLNGFHISYRTKEALAVVKNKQFVLFTRAWPARTGYGWAPEYERQGSFMIEKLKPSCKFPEPYFESTSWAPSTWQVVQSGLDNKLNFPQLYRVVAKDSPEAWAMRHEHSSSPTELLYITFCVQKFVRGFTHPKSVSTFGEKEATFLLM